MINNIIETAVRLLRQIPAGLEKVWIFGILPIYIVLYSLIAVFTMRYTRRSESAKEIRSFRRLSAAAFFEKGLKRFLVIAGYTTLLVVILPAFIVLNLKYDSILPVIEENVFSLCSISLGLTTIVLTVSVVIVLFHKNYYLVFSIDDVLKSYGFTGCIGLLLGSCLGSCVCAALSIYTGSGIWGSLVIVLFEWFLIMCLIFSGTAFWIIYRVMFSNKKIELRLLNRLYRTFQGGGRPDENVSKSAADQDFDSVRTNVEYLCAEYVTAARTVPIHKVEGFECLYGDSGRKTWAEQFRNALKTFMIVSIFVWAVSMTVTSAVLGNEGTGLLLLDTMFLAAVNIPALILYYGRYERLEKILGETSDIPGYELKMENDKRIMIHNIKLTPANRYDRFVRTMNSLSAFFCIMIGRGMGPEVTDQALRLVLDWLFDVKEKHVSIYLPVFAGGYFAFERGHRSEVVLDYYKELISDKSDGDAEVHLASRVLNLVVKGDKEVIYGKSADELKNTLRGYLGYLSRGGAAVYADKTCSVEEYLKWLDGV